MRSFSNLTPFVLKQGPSKNQLRIVYDIITVLHLLVQMDASLSKHIHLSYHFCFYSTSSEWC